MKFLFALFILCFSLLTTGCSASSDNESNTDGLSSKSFVSSKTIASSSKEKKNTNSVIFHAITTVSEESNEENNLFLREFTPKKTTEGGQAYDEVVLLLSDAIPIVTKKTGKPLALKKIKKNTDVEVTLEKDFPMTMSIPPQIPGNSIIKIFVDQ